MRNLFSSPSGRVAGPGVNMLLTPFEITRPFVGPTTASNVSRINCVG